jgi:predicted ATP-dependent serine protease
VGIFLTTPNYHKTLNKMAKPEIKRCATGIKGLDDLIEGGFPPNSINLISGTPEQTTKI